MKKYIFLFMFISAFDSFNLQSQNSNIYPYSINQKFGLIDENCNIILQPIFDTIKLFPNSLYNNITVFGEKDSDNKMKYGFIDKKGKIIMEAKYSNLFYNGNGAFYFISDSLKVSIISLKTHEKLAFAKLKSVESSGSIVGFTDLQTGDMNVIFKNGMVEKNIGLNFFNFTNINDTCSYIQIRDKYYDCNHKKLSEEEFGDDDAFISMIDYIDISDEIKNKFGKEYKLIPIYESGLDESENIISILCKNDTSNLLITSFGNLLFELNQPNKNIEQKKFNGLGNYLVFGNEELKGLITPLGRIVLKEEFINIEESISDYNRVSKSFNMGDNYFKVTHKSGFGGFANKNGKLFLPKECNCF